MHLSLYLKCLEDEEETQNVAAEMCSFSNMCRERRRKGGIKRGKGGICVNW